jgi:beta-phosphoglucomutase-like phosphatase (HAD superfamily)
MTRTEKAELRAQARERRRHPRNEKTSQNGDGAQEEQAQEQEQEEQEPKRAERKREKREPRRGAKQDEFTSMAEQARELLRSVRGVEAESVSGLTRTANGWTVTLEVVELRRIPESTDVLASYEVELDGDGKLLGFERGRRYSRSQAEAGP